MANTPIDERKFTDEEVREILKRSVESTPTRALTHSEGFSLAELKAIGTDVGIDPARLEDAARAVAKESAKRPNTLLGAPTVMDFERRVDSELDPDDTHDAIALIRRIMGKHGEVATIHGSLEWSAKGEAGDRYVTLTSKDGSTTIRGAANLTNSAVLTYLPTGILGLILSFVGLITFVKDGSTIGLVMFLTVLPILYPILRGILGKVTRAESDKLERVVDELARLTEGSAD